MCRLIHFFLVVKKQQKKMYLDTLILCLLAAIVGLVWWISVRTDTDLFHLLIAVCLPVVGQFYLVYKLAQAMATPSG